MGRIDRGVGMAANPPGPISSHGAQLYAAKHIAAAFPLIQRLAPAKISLSIIV